MSISFFKLTKILGLFLITLVIILNSLGLIYLYQESQARSLEYKSLVKQQTVELKKLQEQQTQLSLTLAQKPLPSNDLLHIEWLIQQAYWQVNQLYQPQNAQKLLEFAYQFSEKNHWTTLETSLIEDLHALEAIKFTPPEHVLPILTHLNQELSHINWASPESKFSAQKKSIPAYLKIFQPFIQIEKVRAPVPSVVPPNEQYLILLNLKTLIPQIQYAALTHQQILYKNLLTQFKNQWALIEKQHPNPNISQAITWLDDTQWVLAENLPFRSLSVVQELQQQLNTRAPL